MNWKSGVINDVSSVIFTPVLQHGPWYFLGDVVVMAGMIKTPFRTLFPQRVLVIYYLKLFGAFYLAHQVLKVFF